MAANKTDPTEGLIPDHDPNAPVPVVTKPIDPGAGRFVDGEGRIRDIQTAEQVLHQVGWYDDMSVEDLATAYSKNQDAVSVTRVGEDGRHPLPGMPGGTVTKGDIDMLWQVAQATSAARAERQPGPIARGHYVTWGAMEAVGLLEYRRMAEGRRHFAALAEASGVYSAMETVGDIPIQVGVGISRAVISQYNLGSDIMGSESTRIDTGFLPEPTSGVSSFVAPFSQFLTTFLLAGKGSAKLGLVSKKKGVAGTAARGGEATVRAAASTFVGFEGDEPNLATFAHTLGVEGGIIDFLNSEHADPTAAVNRLRGRLNNALGDMMVGGPIDQIGTTVRAAVKPTRLSLNFVTDLGGKSLGLWTKVDGVAVSKRTANMFTESLVDQAEYTFHYNKLIDEGIPEGDARRIAGELVPPERVNRNARNLQAALIRDAFELREDEARSMLMLAERMGWRLPELVVDTSGGKILDGRTGTILFQKGGPAMDRSIGAMVERVGDSGVATLAHREHGQPARTVDGGRFSESPNESTVAASVTDADLERAWGEAKGSTDADIDALILAAEQKSIAAAKRSGGDVYARQYNSSAPLTAELVNASLKRANNERYFYEIGAEVFGERLRNFTPEQRNIFLNLLIASSARTEVGFDLFRALSMHGDELAGRASTVQHMGLPQMVGALRGRTLDLASETYKVPSFGRAFQYVMGLEATPGMPVLDTVMADGLSVPHAVFSNPNVYESVSRYLIKIRDMVNSQLPDGAEPFTTDQIQAVIWAEIRERAMLSTGRDRLYSNYDDALTDLVDNILPKAGFDLPIDPDTGRRFLTPEIISDPRFKDAIGQGPGRRGDAPKMFLATETTQVPGLDDVVATQRQLLDIANNPGTPPRVAASAMKLYQDITKKWNQVQRGLTEKQRLDLPGGRKFGTVATELAQVVRGEGGVSYTLAASDPAQRSLSGAQTGTFTKDGVYYGSGGTWDGGVEPNLVLPLLDLGGAEARLIDQSIRAVKILDQGGEAKLVQNPEQELMVRRMLGLSDDTELTIDHIRQVSKRPPVTDEGEILDYLAAVAYHTNQEALYATRYEELPTVIDQSFINGLRSGDVKLSDLDYDGDLRPSVFLHGHHVQLDEASRVSRELGLNFTFEQSPTGTQLYFFADDEVEKWFAGDVYSTLADALGIDRNSIVPRLVDMKSTGIDGPDVVSRYAAMEGRITQRVGEPQWARNAGAKPGNVFIWENLLTPGDRAKFHSTGGDPKVILHRAETLKASVLRKIKRAAEAAKKDGDNGDWRQHLKLNEQERALLEPQGIGGKGFLKRTTPGEASRGVSSRGLGHLRRNAEDLWGRSELGRLKSIAAHLAESRTDAYRGVRQQTDKARDWIANQPGVEAAARPGQSRLTVKLNKRERGWVERNQKKWGKRSPSWEFDPETGIGTFESRDANAMILGLKDAPKSLRNKFQSLDYAEGTNLSGRPTVLFQGGESGEARGFAMRQEGERVIIGGLTDPDISTGLEELIHATRLVLLGEAESGGIRAPQELFDAFKKAFGVDPERGVPTEIDEHVADMFHRYILAGEAPDAELQPAFDLLASQMRASFQDATGGTIPEHLPPAAKDFFDKLLTKPDLPVQYAPGRFMDAVPVGALLRKIQDWEARGKDWTEEIAPEDVINLSGKDTGWRFGDDPDDVLQLHAAYSVLAREILAGDVIGRSLPHEELEQLAIRTYNTLMGRGEGEAARSMREYWTGRVQPGRLSEELPRWTLASSLILRHKLDNISDLARVAGETGSHEDVAALTRSLFEFQQVHTVFADMRSAWGRSGHALQGRASSGQVMDRAVAALEQSGDLEGFGRVAALLYEASRNGNIDELPRMVQQAMKGMGPPGTNSSMGDRLLSYMRNNLLSRPSTFFSLSTVGPTFLMVWEGIEKSIGALASGDVRTLKGVVQNLLGNISGGAAAIRYAGRAYRMNQSTLMPGKTWEGIGVSSAMTDGAMATHGPSGILGGLLHSADFLQKQPGRVMIFVDEFFRQLPARTEGYYRFYEAAMEDLLRQEGVISAAVQHRRVRTPKAGKPSTGYRTEYSRKAEREARARLSADAHRQAQENLDKAIVDGRLMDFDQRVKDEMTNPELARLPDADRAMGAVSRAEGSATDDAIVNDLRQAATRYTLQHDPGPIGQRFLSMLEAFPPVKFLIPFARTTINVFGRSGGYSPTVLPSVFVSHVDNLIRNGRWRHLDANSGIRGFHTQTIKDLASKDPAVVARARGRLVASGSIGAMAATLYMQGRLTGHGPTDPNLRRAWLEDHQPNSVKIGDQWVSVRGWTGPVGVIVNMWATALEATNAGWYDDMPAYEVAFIATAHAVGDQSFVTGVSNFLSAIDRPESMGERFMVDMSWAFVPGSQAQAGVQQSMDPTLREADGMLEHWRRLTPFLTNEPLPARYNILGEELSLSKTPSVSWYNFTSPVRIKADGDDAVLDEMMRIGYTPGPAGPNLMGVDLRSVPSTTGTGTAYDDYNRFIEHPTGDTMSLRERLAWAMDLDAYKDASEMQVEGLSPKAQLLERVISQYRQAARGLTIKSNPHLQELVYGVKKASALSTQVGTPAETPGLANELESIMEAIGEHRP